MHYCGLALDLYIWSAMSDKPENDVYAVKLLSMEDRKLEVWAKCENDSTPEVTLNDVLNYRDPGLKNRHELTGRYVNLTQIFEEHGFHPISFRRRFAEDGAPLAAEWWHFQYEEALIPNVSTFGGELQKVYSLSRLERSPVWRYRDRTFKINWF